jgi:hypothetical protein
MNSAEDRCGRRCIEAEAEGERERCGWQLTCEYSSIVSFEYGVDNVLSAHVIDSALFGVMQNVIESEGPILLCIVNV